MRQLKAALASAIISLTPMVTADDACIPALPVPHTNNAVALVEVAGTPTLFSFAGLRKGKTWRDTSKAAFMYRAGDREWQTLPDLPVEEGRLAATMEAVGGRVFFFGGYTVAEDGSEISAPENFAFDPLARSYSRIADMPVPADDAVSFVYQDRLVYLVSGWHNSSNIRDVQVYDTIEDRWFKATNYPGTPVFGHAGGIVGNRFVIADGVAVIGKDDQGRRLFDTVNEGWMGTIDPSDPSKITYRRLPQLPGRGHYRMAGAGDETGNRVLFVGGTPYAYNYSGIGYDGNPSPPKKHVFGWDFSKDTWVAYKDKPVASMDHRGLLAWKDDWITVGGMTAGQQVTEKLLGTEQSSTTCSD